MRILVKVKANSKENQVEEIKANQFLVRVKAPPKEGKANQEVIETLAQYFGVPKGRITILTGLKSRQKILNIDV